MAVSSHQGVKSPVHIETRKGICMKGVIADMDILTVIGLCVAFFAVGYALGKDINAKK